MAMKVFNNKLWILNEGFENDNELGMREAVFTGDFIMGKNDKDAQSLVYRIQEEYYFDHNHNALYSDIEPSGDNEWYLSQFLAYPQGPNGWEYLISIKNILSAIFTKSSYIYFCKRS